MCDFIRTDNIKSVIEHVVTKHLQQSTSSANPSDAFIKRNPSLEDVATPYVDTLTLLRQKHEENTNVSMNKFGSNEFSDAFNGDDQRLMQNERAKEDQVSTSISTIFVYLLYSR